MTAVGDIRNGPFATRAKEYVWSTLEGVFPRGITPSDFDGVVELNRCFFVFEGKTAGTDVPTGQGLCLSRALAAWPVGRSVVVVGEHAPLDKIDVSSEMISARFAWRDDKADKKVRWGPLWHGPQCLWSITRLFVQDAATGSLKCETWAARDEHDGRPFA